jgi:uncharacterized protein YecT (DUF1311 family)
MSLTTKFIVIAVFSLIQMSPSYAASTNELQAIDRAQEACINDDGSNSGMKICTNEALKDADALLNVVYQKFSGELSTQDEQETLTRLKIAQRAWIPFRDAQCQLSAAQMLGGTGESLAILSCHYKMTVDRIKELEAQFDAET